MRNIFRNSWCVIFLVLVMLVCRVAVAEPVQGHDNEADGTKIEDITIHWITPDAPNDETPENLYIRTSSPSALEMVYQIDVALSGEVDYEPGTIHIKIPKQIWEKRGGSGKMGTLALSVPQLTETSKSDFCYVVDAQGNYEIVNNNTIAATSKAMFQLAFENIDPKYIVDESMSDAFHVRIDLTTHKGTEIFLESDELTAQVDTEERLSAAYKGGTFYEDASSVPADVLANLPAGANPADYVFVRWYTYPNYSGNQPLSLWAFDQGSTPDENGQFSAESDLANGVGAYIVLKDEQGRDREEWVTGAIMLGASGKGTVDRANNRWSEKVLENSMEINGTGAYNHVRYIWTAYKNSDLDVMNKTYHFKNRADWRLVEQDAEVPYPEKVPKPAENDPQLETQAHSTDLVSWLKASWDFPTGKFLAYKFTEGTPGHQHSTLGSEGSGGHRKNYTYEMALNRLRTGKSTVMNYEVLSVGYGGIFTCGPLGNEVTWIDKSGTVHKEQVSPDYEDNWNSLAWASDRSHYLNWNYVLDTTDRWERFRDVADADPTLKKKSSDDYRFLGISIASPEMFRWDKQKNPMYYYGNSTYGYSPDPSIPKPAVEVWIEQNNAAADEARDSYEGWTYIGTYTVPQGQVEYVDFASLGYTDVTGYRTRLTTNQAAVKLAVYPKIELKPSARVKAIVEELFRESETPSTTYRNDDMLYIELYKSAEDPSNTAPEQRMFLDKNTYYRQFVNEDNSRATLTGAGYGVTPSKSISFNNRTDNDPENRLVNLHYSARVSEFTNLTTVANWHEAVELGCVKPETHGTWFDLLPEGVIPLTDTVRLRNGDTILSVQTYDNWKNTGRIMLVVEADLTPAPHRNSNGIVEDTPEVHFDATYTWSDINNKGGRLTNYIGFESGDDVQLGNLKGRIGEPDRMVRKNNDSTPTGVPKAIVDAMSDFDPDSDTPRFVYAKTDVNVDVLQWAETEYVKHVRKDRDGIWTQGVDGQEQVIVYEGEGYTYRLHVASSKDTITSEMIMFDSLENYMIPGAGDPVRDKTKLKDFQDVDSKKDWDGDWDRKVVSIGAEGMKEDLEVGGQWRGTLRSIDLSEFIAKQCKPVIYYATEPYLQFGETGSIVDASIFFNYEDRYDLQDSMTWHRADMSTMQNGIWTVPEGLNVSAIALDLRKRTDGAPFELRSLEQAAAYLHMVAPDDHGDENQWHAKGAYAHKNPDGTATSSADIDWIAAMNHENNMHAYNNTRLICRQTADDGSNFSYLTMIRNDYTRVGIVPKIIEVEKAWDDDDNHDNIRPQEITVTLMRKAVNETGGYKVVLDEMTGEPIRLTLREENHWQGVVNQQDVVNEAGYPYIYTFGEASCEGYEIHVQKVDDTHFKVTNRHENETTELHGKKKWMMPDGSALSLDAQDYLPESITVNLYRVGSSGEKESVKSQVVRPDEEGNWAYAFDNLEKYERGGFEYVYSVDEKPVPYFFGSKQDPSQLPAEYVVTYPYDPEDPEEIDNFYFPLGNLTVEKKIEGATDRNRDKLFTYTLMLSQYDPVSKKDLPVTEEFDYVIYDVSTDPDTGEETLTESSTGKIGHEGTFQLMGGQRIRIKCLPTDAKYELHEAEEMGWTQTGVVKGSGKIVAATDTEAVFTNKYTAVGYASVEGLKKLTGRKLDERAFTFELVDMNEGSATQGQVISTISNSAPESGDTQQDPDTGVITSKAGFKFHALIYTEADAGKTFHYQVREKDTARPGYEGHYDSTVHDVYVTVEDNEDGSLTCSVNPSDPLEIAFDNTYEAEGNLELRGWKVLKQRDLQDGEFTFELWKSNENGEMLGDAPIQVVHNDVDGNIRFDPIYFDQDDVSLDTEHPIRHYYLMRELETNDTSMIFPDYMHLFVITPQDDGNGVISFHQQDIGLKKDGTPAETNRPVFINDFRKGSLKVKKTIADENGNRATKFTFRVKLVGIGQADLTLDRANEGNTGNPPTFPTSSTGTGTGTGSQLTVFKATPEQMKGTAYAGLNVETGELCFFRTDPNQPMDPWGNAFRSNGFSSNRQASSDGKFVWFNNVESGTHAWTGNTDRQKIKTVTMRDAIRPSTTTYFFQNCTNLISVNLDKIDTHDSSGNVKPSNWLYGMFSGTPNIKSIDLGAMNLSQTNDVQYAFMNCTSLETLNIGNLVRVGNATSRYAYQNDAFTGTKITRITLGKDTYFDTVSSDGRSMPGTYPYAGNSEYENMKWTNVDDPTKQLTTKELFTTGGHAGTWELSPLYFNLSFDGNEAVGAMATLNKINVRRELEITNNFYKFGYDFDGFEDEDGHVFKAVNGKVTIPGSYYLQKVQNHPSTTDLLTVNLKAIWTPQSNTATSSNDTMTITMYGNESVTIRNIPAYTAYEVWELLPEGWILVERSNDSGKIQPAQETESVFKNQYNPTAAFANITASKQMDGRLAGGYTFELFAANSNWQPVGDRIDVATTTEGGVATFNVINYTQQTEYKKDYYYIIREVIPQEGDALYDPLVDYDTHYERVQVTVTKDADGNLHAVTGFHVNNGVFNNITKPGNLEITKRVVGATAREKNREFLITITAHDRFGMPLHGTYTMNRRRNGAALAAEQLVFSDAMETNGQATVRLKDTDVVLIRDLPHGATYTVEEAPLGAGWTQTVAEGTSGTIAASTTQYTKFENTYTTTGSVALAAEKKVAFEEPEGGKYTFELREIITSPSPTEKILETRTNAPVPTPSPTPAFMPDPTPTPDPEYSQSWVRFTPIEYTREGEHVYEIREIVPQPGDPEYDPSMDYDENVITARVSVRDETGDGHLTTTVVYDDGYAEGGRAFRNKRLGGELKISKSILKATDKSKDTPFTVTLKLLERDNTPVYGNLKATLSTPGDQGATETEITLQLDENGTTAFELRGGESIVIHDLPDQARYTVTENVLPKPTPTPQPTTESGGSAPAEPAPDWTGVVPFWYQVSAENTQGTIVTEETTQASFVNEYAAEGVLELTGTKKMDPETMAIPEGAFSFILTSKKLGEIERAANDASGKVQFKPLVYTGDDVGKTFIYTIREQRGLNSRPPVQTTGSDGEVTETQQEQIAADYAFDSKKYTLEVHVEDPGDGSGKLTVTHRILLDGEEQSDIFFTNSTRVEIPFRKVWKNEGDQADTLRPEFIMVRLLADGKEVARRSMSEGMALEGHPEIWETRFSGLPEYKDGKKIVYTVEEVEEPDYVMEMTEKDGIFEISNTYIETETTIEALKVMKGRPIQAGEYQFVLTPDVNGTPMPAETTVTCDAEGNIAFGPIVYHVRDLRTLADNGVWGPVVVPKTYTYHLSEVIPDDAVEMEDGRKILNDIVYDPKVYDVTVTLNLEKDPETGELVYTAVQDQPKDEVAFRNEYQKRYIEVWKVWKDEHDLLEKRPSTIHATLYADGEALESFTLSSSNHWRKDFEDLPVTREDGTEIEYTVKERKAAGYSNAVTSEVDENGILNLTVTNRIRTEEAREDAEITIRKQDETGHPLPGASFELTGPDGTVLLNWTGVECKISTAGDILKDVLPAVGETTTLKVRETEAPQGYDLDTSEHSVVIGATDRVDYDEEKDLYVITTIYSISVDGASSAVITNHRRESYERMDTQVTVRKVDEKGETLKGAEFALMLGDKTIRTYEGGEFVITSLDEALQSVLPVPGTTQTLTLKETKAPDGYRLDKTVRQLIISSSDTEGYDAATNTYVTTAWFGLKLDGKNEVRIQNVPLNGPQHSSIGITKVDEKDKPLEGAAFVLLGPDGKKLTDFTGASFTISTTDESLKDVLPAHAGDEVHLTLKEVRAPEGYTVSEETWDVTISAEETADEQGDPQMRYTILANGKDEIRIVNRKNSEEEEILYDYVVVRKVNQEDQPLDGALFVLTGPDGRMLKQFTEQTFEISAQDAYLAGYLPDVGKKTVLRLKEYKAPAGYLLNQTTYTVLIEDSVETSEEDQITTRQYTMSIQGKHELMVRNYSVKGTTPINGGPGTPVNDGPARETETPPHENRYTNRFTFTKIWQGGIEDSLEFTLYNPDGTIRSKGFDKKILSENEWEYTAWFTDDREYYVVETVPEGYQVRYENVGKYADVHDRLYNQGTLINYKVPKTGDRTHPLLWTGMLLTGILGMAMIASRKKKHG